MIHNTQTINIDGTVLKEEDIVKAFTFNENDKFSKWVVRPLAMLTAVGMGIAMFFASAFLIIISLAMVPLIAVSLWAFKKKVERDLAMSDPVVDTQTGVSDEPAADTQNAS